jgi:hypothetical protein
MRLSQLSKRSQSQVDNLLLSALPNWLEAYISVPPSAAAAAASTRKLSMYYTDEIERGRKL